MDQSKQKFSGLQKRNRDDLVEGLASSSMAAPLPMLRKESSSPTSIGRRSSSLDRSSVVLHMLSTSSGSVSPLVQGGARKSSLTISRPSYYGGAPSYATAQPYEVPVAEYRLDSRGNAVLVRQVLSSMERLIQDVLGSSHGDLSSMDSEEARPLLPLPADPSSLMEVCAAARVVRTRPDSDSSGGILELLCSISGDSDGQQLRDSLQEQPASRVDEETAEGFTPLMVAVSRGQAKGVQLLLEHGATAWGRSSTVGVSALDLAVEAHAQDPSEQRLETLSVLLSSASSDSARGGGLSVRDLQHGLELSLENCDGEAAEKVLPVLLDAVRSPAERFDALRALVEAQVPALLAKALREEERSALTRLQKTALLQCSLRSGGEGVLEVMLSTGLWAPAFEAPKQDGAMPEDVLGTAVARGLVAHAHHLMRAVPPEQQGSLGAAYLRRLLQEFPSDAVEPDLAMVEVFCEFCDLNGTLDATSGEYPLDFALYIPDPVFCEALVQLLVSFGATRRRTPLELAPTVSIRSILRSLQPLMDSSTQTPN